MRWFKHMTDSHADEKLAMVQAELGFEGYGLYWFLLETIAKQMEAENCKTFVEYPPNFWQRLTGLYPNKFKRLVNVLEKFGLLTANFSQKSIRIDCPNLLKYRDEWSRKKRKNSGATPEQLRCKDTDTDTEEEKDKEEDTRCAGLVVFCSDGEIHLQERDVLGWIKAYPNIDVPGYLRQLMDWSRETRLWEKKKAFFSTSGALNKANQAAAIPKPSVDVVHLTPEQEDAMFGPGWQVLYGDKGKSDAA